MTFSIPSSNSMTPLCSATKNGDVAHVRALLLQGADVKETSGPNGMTALHIAAIADQAEIAYILCHADGADVDIQTQDGFAPLFLAVRCRRKDVVSALLTKNPKILLPNGKDKSTAFHEAAKLGELGILRQFFGRTFPGTDVNAKCEPDNNTPLHLAALNGDKASIEYLSQLFGTEINLKKANSTPLGCAIEKKNKANFTPLGCAILQGHLDAVNALLEAGADPYAKCGPDQLPAIHLAAYYGHASIVKRLCAIPGIVHHKTQVPLDRCAVAGLTTKSRKELFKKAGIPYPNHTDITPLYSACEQGHVDAARALLDAGADVNLVCEPYRLSALHVAANNKQTQVFKELCKVPGIQLEQRTLEDLTPLGLVIGQGTPDMLDCLLKAGANPNSVMAEMKYSLLHFAISLKKPEVVQRLLLEKDKIKKNPRDAEDHSPLFDAVVLRQKDIVEMLLQEGVDPNETFEKFQWTVLHYAAGKGSLDIVESLCSDVRTAIDKKGVDGNTALDIAEKNKKHDVVNFFRSQSTLSSEDISADKIQKLINQKKYSEAKTAAKKLLRDHPENDDLLTVLGQISFSQTHYNEAHQYYLQALALVEKKHAADIQKYWNYRGQTEIALAQNRPSEAEKFYEKAVKVQPDNSVHITYFLSLGEAFQKQGNFAKADEYFKK
ncbi:MAG TPA: ankyrin repeat domain-containing protein, partial [Rhabdochlamydiaceae bacterium]